MVIAAGRLNPRKAFDRLLRAWARVAHEWPDWRLDIFGTGPERDALERLAGELGIGGQRSPARPQRADAGGAGEGVRCSSMTSRREGFPMVLLEAMSVGLPVVAYDCPTGPRDIVTDGVDGYIVPDGDTETLGAVLDRLMADEDRRRALGAAAVKKVARYQARAAHRPLGAPVRGAVGAEARSAAATRRQRSRSGVSSGCHGATPSAQCSSPGARSGERVGTTAQRSGTVVRSGPTRTCSASSASSSYSAARPERAAAQPGRAPEREVEHEHLAR